VRDDKAEDPFQLIGRVVDGRYRVECVAGEGGFGVVYRAFHLGFAARIALKVLKLPRHWSNARREARIVSFQREGRMLFELSRLHPSIVRAYETGTIWAGDARAPYLSLEWLDGVSLDQELRYRRRRGLPPFELHEVLTLLEGSAAGLARAHAQGVAHRDIKPGNLFIDTGGKEPQIKILDFGIAKLDEPTGAVASEHAGAANSGASFTPMYAAPEQWSTRFGPTGPRTDVHALALVCGELLSGRAPFPGAEHAQFEAACLDAGARPTPAALGVRLPERVEAVLARAVALDPRERYEDVGAFWKALCRAAKWSPTGASVRIVALASEPPPASLGSSSDASPRSARSAPVNPRATSVTSSRVVPDVPRPATRRTRPLRLGRSLAMSAGIAAIVSLALFERGARAFLFGRTPRVEASTASRTQPSELRVSPQLELLTTVRRADESGSLLPLEEPETAGVPSISAPGTVTRAPMRDRTPRKSAAARADVAPPVPVPSGEPLPSLQLEVNLDDPGLTRRK